MPQIQKRDEAPPLHKQGKLPAWEQIPVPDVGDLIKKNKEIIEREPEQDDDTDCGCW